MSNIDEKVAFSERLKSALLQAKHPISPTYLSNEFNLRYDGQPISVQSANNWLLGKAIPNQDKLSLLAIWLNVSSQWLRFGDSENSPQANLSQICNLDADILLKFNRLSKAQKSIIANIIDEFIQK